MTNIPDNQSSNAPENTSGSKSTDSNNNFARDGQETTSSSRSGSRSRGSSSKRNDRRAVETMRRSTSTTIQAPIGGRGRELNFFDVINILERQAWIVITSAVVVTAIAGYLFVNQQKRYAASASVYIPATNSVSILSGVDRSQGNNLMQNMRGDKIETHAMIVKSYQILSNTWRDVTTNESAK